MINMHQKRESSSLIIKWQSFNSHDTRKINRINLFENSKRANQHKKKIQIGAMQLSLSIGMKPITIIKLHCILQPWLNVHSISVFQPLCEWLCSCCCWFFFFLLGLHIKSEMNCLVYGIFTLKNSLFLCLYQNRSVEECARSLGH